MSIAQHIFREYDIRGLMDKEIDYTFVRLLGYVLAQYFKKNEHSHILIGYDTRKNSIDYHNILCEELNKNGCDVISLGMIPSPCLYFAVHHLQIFAGIMITASHNDAPYNGFKIWQGKSTLHGESIREIYQSMLKIYQNAEKESVFLQDISLDTDIHSGADFLNTPPIKNRAPQDISSHTFSPYTSPLIGCSTYNLAYTQSTTTHGISSYFDIKTPYTKKLHEQTGELSCKVVVDGSNASAGELCCEILQKMGVHVIPLYCEPTSDFPNHPPDPTIAKNCEELCKQIIQHKADYGIGLDGDGDRLVMVDRNGRILACDELLSLLARDTLLRIPKARILADVKCTHHLFKEVEELGGIAIMAPTGHSLMKSAMQKEKAHIGGELSGHFFHAENWFGTDDGILTAVRVLAILRDRNWDLTQFPMWEKSYASPEIRFECPEDIKHLLIKKAQGFYTKEYKDGSKNSNCNSTNNSKNNTKCYANTRIKVNCMDGVRIDFDTAWFLIRASNTSAALTLRFEADSEDALHELKTKKIQRLTDWLAELP